MDPTRKYVLSKHAYFRALNDTDVAAILVNGTSIVIAAKDLPLVMAFSLARTPSEALAVTGANEADFTRLLTPLVTRGLIEAASTFTEPNESWLSVLRPALPWADISAALKTSRCVILRDAFEKSFADAIHAELQAIDPWPMSEDLAQKHFSSFHHNIYNPLQLPAQTQRARQMFGSEKTKALIGDASGSNCAGPLQFSASCYFPGDYSLPHKDALGARSVAFVWHLAKDWDPSWGGAFYWVPTATYVPASYNTFIVFNVSEKSQHFVTQVNARAQGKRLALNGWWLSDDKHPLTPAEDAPLSDAAVIFL